MNGNVCCRLVRTKALEDVMYLPSLSKVNTESYSWHIEKYSEKVFTFYEQARKQGKSSAAYGVSALRSPDFTLSLVVDGDLKKVKLCLWLMRDTTKARDGTLTNQSQRLKLDLSETDKQCDQPYRHDASKLTPTDRRHICTAWISGRQKECLSKLIGGQVDLPEHGAKHIFTNPEFVLYNDLFDKEKGLVCDDKLSIVCEVHAFTSGVSYVDSWLFDPLKPTVVQYVQHTLKSDLKQLLDTRKNSDVTLIASSGQEFPAHTFMLSSRSTVFAAMFEHNMKKKEQKRVNIDDLSSNAVAGLLEFIYTDTVPDIATRAPELLLAAHKYDIPRLTTLCEEAMTSNLKIENAAYFLLLADHHGASQLRNAAKRFTLMHLRDVKATSGWKELSAKQELYDELMDDMANLMAQLTSS